MIRFYVIYEHKGKCVLVKWKKNGALIKTNFLT